MSDVIPKPGLYRQQNGRPADVKWVGDGKALGFDSNGEETAWWTATGKWTVEAPDDFGFHITGPWIPDPPEPPPGFAVMPKDYVAKVGDWAANNGHQKKFAVIDPRNGLWIGWSAERLDYDRPHNAPHYIAAPMPKPFSISEHGPGVYETRDGEEATVKRQCSVEVTYIWKGCTQSLSYASWADGGQFEVSRTLPHDLVRYLRPLPQPAVDPVWRELGPDEPIVDSDQFAFRDHTSNVHDDSYFVDSFDSMVGQTVRQLNQQYPGFGGRIVRRRVAPPAQSEWVPTNELRLAKCAGSAEGAHISRLTGEMQWSRIEQKWTNGTDSEWRPIPVEGA